jgi:DNA repair protein RadC
MSRPTTISLYRVQLVHESAYPYRTSILTSSKEAAEFFRPLYQGIDREQFTVAFLDAKHRVIGLDVVAIGSLTAALVHPREVFKSAVITNSAAIILCHNHPSGVPDPSPEDRQLTSRLCQAGELLGIRVLDHVILGESSHYSFVDMGALIR